MTSPNVRSETTDKRNNDTDQVTLSGEAVAARIISRLDALKITERQRVAWLSNATGIASNTIRDALARGPSRAEMLIKIARALDVDVEWLATGATASRDTLDSRAAAAQAGSMMAPEWQELLHMFGQLSRLERIAVWQMLETLSGHRPSVTPFAPDATATLHDKRTGYRTEG